MLLRTNFLIIKNMKINRPGLTSGLLLGAVALGALLAAWSLDWSLSSSVGAGPSGRDAALGAASTKTKAGTAEEAHVRQVYASLPLSFEANRGQTDQQVRFFSRGRGYTVFLTPTEAVLVLGSREALRPSTSLRTGVRREGKPQHSDSSLITRHPSRETQAVLRMWSN